MGSGVAGRIRRLRPDWMTIVTGSRTGSELDTELIGYAYQPGGPASGEDPVDLVAGAGRSFRADSRSGSELPRDFVAHADRRGNQWRPGRDDPQAQLL